MSFQWFGIRVSVSASFLFSLLSVALLLSCTPPMYSQENATVNGTVTDPSGAVVPNAGVNLTNDATHQVRTAASNSVGAYRFANLGIGTYTLTVSAAGFEKYTKNNIVVNVAQTLEENAILALGSGRIRRLRWRQTRCRCSRRPAR